MACKNLREEGKDSSLPIGRLIMKEGVISRDKPAIHNEQCDAQKISKFAAVELDRQQRMQITATSHVGGPKTLWRQGMDRAIQLDAITESDMEETMSVQKYYPSWPVVRKSYNRRRRQTFPPIDDKNIYKLPTPYTITKNGVALLQAKDTTELQRNEIIQKHKWLLKADEENGLLIFASPRQLEAKKKCSILCSDGTFQLVPKQFKQLFTIHGLVLFWVLIKNL